MPKKVNIISCLVFDIVHKECENLFSDLIDSLFCAKIYIPELAYT